MHITRLMENPATHGEGAQFIQDYQNITQAAQAIIQEVEEQQGQQQQQQGMDPSKTADLQLKAEKLRQEGIKLGMKAQEMEDLRADRAERNNLAKRSQFTGEINEERRLELDKEKLKVQAIAQKNKPKPKSK
jgi:hypothetical protein